MRAVFIAALVLAGCAPHHRPHYAHVPAAECEFGDEVAGRAGFVICPPKK